MIPCLKKKGKKKKTISGRKQSVSEKELSYLRQRVESSVIAAFASHKPLKPQWKVKKPTGPIANKPMPHGSKWKTYWGKFVTFKKDGKIYFVFFIKSKKDLFLSADNLFKISVISLSC